MNDVILDLTAIEKHYQNGDTVVRALDGVSLIQVSEGGLNEISNILIPRESSVFCAAGMLISDLKHDYVRTYVRLHEARDEASPVLELRELLHLFGIDTVAYKLMVEWLPLVWGGL